MCTVEAVSVEANLISSSTSVPLVCTCFANAKHDVYHSSGGMSTSKCRSEKRSDLLLDELRHHIADMLRHEE